MRKAFVQLVAKSEKNHIDITLCIKKSLFAKTAAAQTPKTDKIRQRKKNTAIRHYKVEHATP